MRNIVYFATSLPVVVITTAVFAGYVYFGAIANSGGGEKVRPLGESCKDYYRTLHSRPTEVKDYMTAEAEALKMKPEFYVKWCARLDQREDFKY